MNSLVNRAEPGRNIGTRRMVLATIMLVAILLPFDPVLLRQGNISMAKNAAADEIGKAARDTATPLARDPELAVQEEYQAARLRGTAQALELFIARHPDSPLAEKARADLRRLPR